jgi:outer membrane protein W
MERKIRVNAVLGACWMLVGAHILSLSTAGVVQAESYVSGMVGYTIAQDTTRGKVNDPANVGLPAGTTISNVDLNNSLMYGVKLGHYFNSTPWLGVELESFMTTPHRPAQRLTLFTPAAGSFQQDEPGATNRVIVVSPNLVMRYQAGSFEPYVGIGPGVFFLHQKQLTGTGTDYSQTSTRFGLNTQLGLRYRITEHVSMFGEWKYNYARINLAGQADVNHFGINAVINLHHFVFGVGYHF